MATIRRICENRIIPVIFVTTDPESVFAAYAEAVVVEKPFISADLKAAVATALASCERSSILHQPSGNQL